MMSELRFIYNKSYIDVTAKQLFDDYHDRLPILVYVTQGFYGNREEMVFSTGQVLRLHAVRAQGRALMHDDRKFTYTVPIEYRHKFCLGNDLSRRYKLHELAQGRKLPIHDVYFADRDMLFELGAAGEAGSHSFKKLSIVSVYDQSYFIANTVINGEVCPEVLPIPLYLKDVKFSVVVGAEGQGIKDGGYAKMEYLQCDLGISHVDFDGDNCDHEMVQLSHKQLKPTDDIYQNIDTNIYYNVNRRYSRRSHEEDGEGDYSEAFCPPQVTPSQSECQTRLSNKPILLPPSAAGNSNSTTGGTPGRRGGRRGDRGAGGRHADQKESTYANAVSSGDYEDDAYEPVGPRRSSKGQPDESELVYEFSLPPLMANQPPLPPAKAPSLMTKELAMKLAERQHKKGKGENETASTSSTTGSKPAATAITTLLPQKQINEATTSPTTNKSYQYDVISKPSPLKKTNSVNSTHKPETSKYTSGVTSSQSMSNLSSGESVLAEARKGLKSSSSSSSSSTKPAATAAADKPAVCVKPEKHSTAPNPDNPTCKPPDSNLTGPATSQLPDSLTKPKTAPKPKPTGPNLAIKPTSPTPADNKSTDVSFKPQSPTSSKPSHFAYTLTSPATKCSAKPSNTEPQTKPAIYSPKSSSPRSQPPSHSSKPNSPPSNPPSTLPKPKSFKKHPATGEDLAEETAGAVIPQDTDNSHVYTNHLQMGVVKPTMRSTSPDRGDNCNNNSVAATTTLTPVPASQHIGDSYLGQTPLDHKTSVQALTIAQVKGILQQLNLQAYEERFERELVDGMLLCRLNEEALMTDFSMSVTEATRLRNYVEMGHLPRAQ